MAHLFSNDFNSIVLRGGKVRYDEKLKSAVLDRDGIADLVTRGLKAFEGNRAKNPKRLVIHKTSAYTADEIAGVQDAVQHLNIALDLVSLTKTPFRFVRWGKYPVPRGTTYVATERDAFLYTKGFVPELQTYPGSHIPAPFHVQRAVGDSDIGRICSDILALTKLNWNTADFCCGVPITLSFARNVGDVFKEFGEDTAYQPSEFFRFYM
jgi:argonaute-like protein implicated in RNA metabolism and viral defense